ncbi:hypothetical protein TUBRATIS_17370 [Tubulinosema ratisbonensis]|uniref:Uncharacterized protein n=1 Tax=Tubulinosema ratisbonensis TaxID=291195 RepID=A0A437AL07_9MICR|nr:hypothetical protein TUBRATIS_17370 [Tubulinosema ratisbonensis]
MSPSVQNSINNIPYLSPHLFFDPNTQPLLMPFYSMPNENKPSNTTQHEHRYHPYQRPIDNTVQETVFFNLTTTYSSLNIHFLEQLHFKIQYNDSSSYFITYQSILEAIKDPKIDALDKTTEHDIKLDGDDFKNNIGIINNNQLFRTNLHSLVQRSIRKNCTPLNSRQINHLIDLIIMQFEYNYKQIGLFTIYILFFTKGFEKYTLVDSFVFRDNLFNRHERKINFSNRAIINTIKIWKGFNVEFDTIKEGYDILVNLGKYFLFDKESKNILSFVEHYKKFLLSSLSKLFLINIQDV